MRVFDKVLILYSYLFHAVLALFLTAIAAVALLSAAPSLRLDMLPWSGASAAYWLLGINLAGLLSILLAITGKFRYLYPVFGAAVFGLMVRGFIFSPYQFRGVEEFQWVLALILGAFGAFLGSLVVVRGKKKSG